MARLTLDAHEGYLKDIMSHYENPDEAADILQALRDDFSESLQSEDVVPRSEYDELKQKYTERFFGGDTAMSKAKAAQKEDIEKDSKPLTYADLLKDYENYDGKDD